MSMISVKTFPTPADAARELADEVASLIRTNDEAGRPTVLGLATGSSPLPFYAELVRRHREEGLSFKNVTTFNLDEYLGLPPDHPESYRHFMQTNLFDHIDVDPARTHVPSGLVADDEIGKHCAEYEEMIKSAGGIALQILGIGRTGHIGFNEPGSPRDSRTRSIELDELTRRDAAPAFGGIENVPTRAITMGCGTILDARRLRLMAWGEAKASIVRKALRGPVTPEVSASFLQEHPDSQFLLDEAAASALD
jgi:glucosamine-6-phosphate deaminase